MMTPRDRLMTTLRGDQADRVPLELPGFQFATREEIDNHPDPLRREIAHRVFDEQVLPIAIPSSINRYLVTPPQRLSSKAEPLANGNRRVHGKIDTPKGELTFISEFSPVAHTTWQVKYPVETMGDIEKIASIPWERPPGLAPPDMGALPADFGYRGILQTRISSPLVCVAGMMNYEQFLELAITEPDLIAELTEICRVRILDVLEVLLSEPGIEYVWMGGSEWVTPPMASPSIYDALVQEQEQSIIEYIHEHSEAVVHIHCHGHARHALQRCIERGADYTEPVEPPPDGDITLAEAKKMAAGRITLGGNVECRILCNESEEAVEQAVREAFEGGKDRFVLRPTEGPSPHLSEQEYRNWMRMIDVWQELSAIG